MLQVAQVLRNRIKSGESPPGSKLAPEVKLADEFDVSVITIQRALRDLSEEGLISRHRGRGTFVREPQLPVVKPEAKQDVLSMMFEGEFGKGTRLIERTLVGTPPNLLSTFPESPKLIRIARVACHAGRPASYAIAHIRREIGEQLSPAALRKYPTFRLVRDVLGVKLRDVEMHLQARAPDPETADHLEISQLEPVLTYRGVLRDVAGEALIDIVINFPGDDFIFRFSIDLRMEQGTSAVPVDKAATA